MINSIFYGRVRRIHFIGIGGIGMSGIAEVLSSLGLEVSGSDIAENANTKRLAALGVQIQIGHQIENVQEADVVVASSDIKNQNVEVVEAHRLNIPVIPRAEMLAELMRLRHGIAVAGSHGKTTTTSLVACILQHAHLDPTIVIGGRVNQMGSNAKLGAGPFLVAEADESDGSFKLLSPSITVVTNIDLEHVNYWTGGLPQLKEAFTHFLNSLPFYGLGVVCTDSENVRAILPDLKRRVATYGIEQAAEYMADDIYHEGLLTTFSVSRHRSLLGTIHLHLVGKHNVLNALAAIAVADELKIPFETIRLALESFQGVERRFTQIGEVAGITIIDDYGHHPTEIKAVLSAAKLTFPSRRLMVLFQPHRHTRTQGLFQDFTHSFEHADVAIVSDIYAAGETPIEGVDSKTLAQACNEQGFKQVWYGGDLANATSEIALIAEPGDVIITLGAGTITKSGPQLMTLLRERLC